MIVTECLNTALMRDLITPLLEAHFREVGATNVYELAPDWAKYDAIDSQGNLMMHVAIVDNRCVGYAVCLFTPHLHYERQTVCYNDVIYVAPEHRTGSAGGRLMAAVRKGAKAREATLVQWHAKPNTALNDTLSRRIPVFEHCYQDIL